MIKSKKILTVITLMLLLTGCAVGTGPNNPDNSDTTASNKTDNDNQGQFGNNNSNIIDFSNEGLTEVPTEILSRSNVTKLDLSNNNISSIPAEIGQMTGLVELDVSANNLTGALPAEIRKLSKLKKLNASDNDLTGIPAEIGQMKNLEFLDLSSNNIDTYPNELSNISQNLKDFNISNNLFSEETINRIENILPQTAIIK